jgi:hypothetical protein
MTWICVDDQAPRHPKLVAAGYQTWPLWMAGLCYCGANLTDGFIPRDVVPTLVPGLPRRMSLLHASRLTVAGLWLLHQNGFQVHDYVTLNRSRADVLKERKAASDRRRGTSRRPNVADSAVADVRRLPDLTLPPPIEEVSTGVEGARVVRDLLSAELQAVYDRLNGPELAKSPGRRHSGPAAGSVPAAGGSP